MGKPIDLKDIRAEIELLLSWLKKKYPESSEPDILDEVGKAIGKIASEKAKEKRER